MPALSRERVSGRRRLVVAPSLALLPLLLATSLPVAVSAAPEAAAINPARAAPRSYPAGIREGTFRWVDKGVDIHYLKAPRREEGGGSTGSTGSRSSSPSKQHPLVFLPGFGVGSFQFIENLARSSRRRESYALDWLGQGRSWPLDSSGLQFSADLWVEQAAAFIRDVVKEPAYVAGNSLGGFLGAQLAAKHPELVKGVVLLNATPFWAFRNPDSPDSENKKQGSGLIWDGLLPAPSGYKYVAEKAFDALRDESNVNRILGLVYANPESSAHPNLTRDIIDSAGHPEGPNAYASIVFSPRAHLPFAKALARSVEAGVPYLMLYGRDDPWVVPLWGQRACLQLELALRQSRRRAASTSNPPETGSKTETGLPEIQYIEITPAGHCPHDEAPEAVATVIEDWFREHLEQNKGNMIQADSNKLEINHRIEEKVLDSERVVREKDGREISVYPRKGCAPRNVGEWAGTALLRARLAFARAAGR